jgi:hypothetical protein
MDVCGLQINDRKLIATVNYADGQRSERRSRTSVKSSIARCSRTPP